MSRTYNEIVNVKRENSATLYSMDHLEDIWLSGKVRHKNSSMRSHSYEGRREHSELVLEDIKPGF